MMRGHGLRPPAPLETSFRSRRVRPRPRRLSTTPLRSTLIHLPLSTFRLRGCQTAGALALSVWLGLTAAVSPPVAHADMRTGNYELLLTDRYDFHTWIWAISSCPDNCVNVTAIPRPVAKAFEYSGSAHFIDGRYTLTVDVPDGLRCGHIYYGPVLPTRDVYSWDALTLSGSVDSSFARGCDGVPGMNTYPFTLARM